LISSNVDMLFFVVVVVVYIVSTRGILNF